MNETRIFTDAVRVGGDDEGASRGIAPAIHQSAVYRFEHAESAEALHDGEVPGFVYARLGTPTQSALEHAICAFEQGEAALAVASGMAAISVALLSGLQRGDHLVAPRALYASTGTLLDEVLPAYGIDVTSVDARHPAEIERAIRDETRVLFIETPSNPTLQLTDIRAAAKIARQHGLVLVADNTFATPVNQNPIALGADVVVHSATKYLGGHSDVLAGVIVGSREFIDRAKWHTARLLGPTIAPFSAWLVLRGIRTLPIRVERQNATGLRVASFLESHEHVRQVMYPGLASHPQHELAMRQMRGFGGMVSFRVRDDAFANRCLDALRLCNVAPSLGGVETLIQRMTMTSGSASANRQGDMGIAAGLVRLSVGLERADDIIDDLSMGLETAAASMRPRKA